MDAAQLQTRIVSNTRFAKDHFLLTLSGPTALHDSWPGQFIHVRVSNGTEPLLRRPLSIHQVRVIGRRAAAHHVIDIIYAVKGKGTALIAQKKPGDMLEVIGPLGSGFDYMHKNNKALANAVPCLIAGGMGVAPLALLADKITKIGRPSNAIGPLVLIGAPKKTHIFCEDHFRKAGCRVFVATDDGSRGLKGTVVDLFLKKIKTEERPVVAYSCGPRAMLKSLAKQCLIHKIPLQVSLEEFMGCGIGACLGCVIETTGGYKRVCSDGPVFRAQDICWNF